MYLLEAVQVEALIPQEFVRAMTRSDSDCQAVATGTLDKLLRFGWIRQDCLFRLMRSFILHPHELT